VSLFRDHRCAGVRDSLIVKYILWYNYFIRWHVSRGLYLRRLRRRRRRRWQLSHDPCRRWWLFSNWNRNALRSGAYAFVVLIWRRAPDRRTPRYGYKCTGRYLYEYYTLLIIFNPPPPPPPASGTEITYGTTRTMRNTTFPVTSTTRIRWFSARFQILFIHFNVIIPWKHFQNLRLQVGTYQNNIIYFILSFFFFFTFLPYSTDCICCYKKAIRKIQNLEWIVFNPVKIFKFIFWGNLTSSFTIF